MTAVPHEGLAGRIRAAREPRVIRPSSIRQPAAQPRSRIGVARRGARRVAGVQVAAVAAPAWLGNFGEAVTSTNVRFVLAGRRVRLGNGAFVCATLGALSAILVSLLMLNTALTTDSFHLQDVRIRNSQLTVAEQGLIGQLADLQSPGGLATRARELGMVPAASPVFLNLSDSRVLGSTDPAKAPEVAAKPKAKKHADSPEAGLPVATDGVGGESVAVLQSGPVVAVPEGPAVGDHAPTVEPPTAAGGEIPLGLVGAVR